MQYLKKIMPTKERQNGGFSALVILVITENGEITASSSYLSHRLRIRAFHVLEQISGLAEVLTVWHTSGTTPAA